MASGEVNEWQKDRFDCERKKDAFVPVVGDVGYVNCFFNRKIDDSDEHAVETENKHSANGDEGNESKADVVETATEVDEAEDGEEVDNVIEKNMEYETVFVDMPVEKCNADQ